MADATNTEAPFSAFVSFQIAPTVELSDFDGSSYFEMCGTHAEQLEYAEHEAFLAERYSIYGRNEDGTVDWLSDHTSSDSAANTLGKILGRPIEASEDVQEVER